MISKNTLITVCLICIVCIFVTGCKPASRAEIEKHLNEVLTIEYTYISMSAERNSEGDQVNTYNFEDANGIEFYVSSTWGKAYSHAWFPEKINRCSYVRELSEIAREALEDICGSDSIVESSSYFSIFIRAESFDDLPVMAACIVKALSSVEPFSVSRNEYRWNFNGSFPYIETFGGRFYFRCEGEDIPSEQDILYDLQYEYVDAVRGDRIEEKLPDEIMSLFPHSKLYDIKFNGNIISSDDPVLAYKLKAREYNLYKISTLKNLIALLGGTYEFESEAVWSSKECSWRIGNDTWKATFEKYENSYHRQMVIFKNGEKIEASPRFDHQGRVRVDGSSRCTISDLEQMLGVSIKIDQKTKMIEIIKN